jgi:tetratricopeptide (TPR) repeat protein
MTATDHHEGAGGGRSRRRGVRASRIKLSAALTSAGLRTQAALAERMADLEGLDAPPRGIVYRVFRQQPVDLNTLTRVAQALGVEAYTLLLSSDEISEAADDALEPVQQGSGGDRWRLASPLTAALALLIIAPLLAVWLGSQSVESPPAAGPPPEVRTDLSDLAFAVLPFRDDAGGRLADAVRAKLAEHARVATAGIVDADSGGDDAAAVAGRFGADVVVDGRVISLGRHAAVRLGAWADGARRVFWVSHTRRQNLEERRHDLAAAAVDALRVALGSSAELGPLPTVTAQRDYVRGQHYLDQSRTELNVRRAINRFEAALRGGPQYAAAHAGLCQALLQESLISSDANILPDAERACAEAAELAPELPVVNIARGNLARRTGELDQARKHFEAVLAHEAKHPDALMGMAEVALAEYRAGDTDAGSRAVEYASRAVEAAPAFWKPPFTLARIHFFTGNVDDAIAMGEAAVDLDANEHTLANLGTSYFCRGDHQQALDRYLRARDSVPDASMGEEQMCVAYYFARRFDDAVNACRAAVEIDSAGGRPAHHEMWGNLADAYRQAGRPGEAADAYARAAELTERKLLVRGNSPNDRAHLAYYYVALESVDETRVPPAIAEKLPGELTAGFESAVDPQALIRIASAWMLLGEPDTARVAYAAGTADCAGFGASPDLDGLRG